MEFYNKIWKRKIPQIIFYLALTIELIMVILDKSDYINPIEGLLFRITFLLFALKLILTEYSFKEWCLIIFLEVIAVISYKITGKNDMIRIMTFVSACKGIPLKQALRYTFYVTLAGCVAIVFLSVTDIYGKMELTADFGRGYKQTRYVLGMGHPNALSCMFLMLLAIGVYVYSERMKWYTYLFLMLLNVGVYKLTDSKTSMLITTFLLAGSFLMTYCRFFREKGIAYICGVLVFLLCIGISVDAAANAPKVRKAGWCDYYLGDPQADARIVEEFGITNHVVALLRLDEKLNGRIISLTDTENNDGTIETWSLFSCPHNMKGYFDMGWVKLFYRYGILPGILYCIACLTLLWRFYQKRDAFGLVVFTALAVYTIMEAHLFSIYIGRNFLLMMMGSYLFTAASGEELQFIRKNVMLK